MKDRDLPPSAAPGEQEPQGHRAGPDAPIVPLDADRRPKLPFAVVAMGASAGGLEAFIEFFKAMRLDSGMAFVLIQHMPPGRESLMAEILTRHIAMPVTQATDGMPIEPNHVYVSPPGGIMTIRDRALRLSDPLTAPSHTHPVDHFFKSLAEEQRERAVCVVMSGMGSNGTAGCKAIKAVGGFCIAEDPTGTPYPAMPQNLIDAGYADCILRPQDMPGVLVGYAAHPYARGVQDEEELMGRRGQDLRREILTLLRMRTRQDFSGYKMPTLLRRIQRRMGVGSFATLGEYVRHLRQNPVEVSALADDLLIHVTGFFRDRDAWEALRARAIVPLIASREPEASVRAWVTACASGEEAYTLAMLLVEEAERVAKPLDIKVFATDMTARSLSAARAGIYPGATEAEVASGRLARFFEKDDGSYRVRQDLRERVIFAPQNVLQDPPFSRLDIATCRNLLIYLEPQLQRRVLSLLHFGLREGGVLFLGTSETVTSVEDLFEPVDKKSRIFRRVGPTRHGAVEFLLAQEPESAAVADDDGNAPLPRGAGGVAHRPSLAQMTSRALLEHHTLAAVTIDRDHRIVYFHGNTNAFLDQPRGETTRDLLTMARESVRGAVRMALYQAVSTGAAAALIDGWVELEPGRRVRVAVTASPLDPKIVPDYYVVSFQYRGDSVAELAEAPPDEASEGPDAELNRVRDELTSAIQELQNSNAELKASQEELMSANEEYQSTNEELDSSREEMQSLNEELTTINAQLMAKMEEHRAASNDLASLLASTDIAVIFLDTRFNIRRFTPAARQLLRLIPTDVGRPLSDLVRKFTDPDLTADAETVLENLVPIEREVAGDESRWYWRRVMPYRTADNRIEGVVITLVDVTGRKQAEDALREAKESAEASNAMKDQFLATLSHELRTPLTPILIWSRALRDTPESVRDTRRALDTIYQSAESQLGLVNDLLDTARITSGKLRLEPRETDLVLVVGEAVEAVRPAVAAKGVRLVVEPVPAGAGVGIVLGDPDRLRQVAWNLLNNAMKFTPQGGLIDVAIARLGRDVEIRVADTGQGISPELLPHVFEPFRQGDSSYTRAHGGLGLGLAITRQLVELHGGTIKASSPGLGRGATFVVRLPLPRLAESRPSGPIPAPTHREVDAPDDRAPLAGAHILLVEDDPATQVALVMLLQGWGAEVATAGDVPQALVAFGAKRPDVLVCDIGLPGEDGYALLYRIHSTEAAAGAAGALPVPAIALSAFVLDEDRRRAAAAGFRRHVGKPPEPKVLLSAIREALGRG